MTLLGFYLAEGSGNPRAGIRFAIGSGNAHFVPEIRRASIRVFGRIASQYRSDMRIDELRINNRVAALAWCHLFGFDGVTAVTKRIPGLVFEVDEDLRSAFLRGTSPATAAAPAARCSGLRHRGTSRPALACSWALTVWWRRQRPVLRVKARRSPTARW